MPRYIGFCGPRWEGGDVTGTLLVETPTGWMRAGGHISSGVGWAEQDIRRHYDRREPALADDSYEWIGQQLDSAKVASLYPPALRTEGASDA